MCLSTLGLITILPLTISLLISVTLLKYPTPRAPSIAAPKTLDFTFSKIFIFFPTTSHFTLFHTLILLVPPDTLNFSNSLPYVFSNNSKMLLMLKATPLMTECAKSLNLSRFVTPKNSPLAFVFHIGALSPSMMGKKMIFSYSLLLSFHLFSSKILPPMDRNRPYFTNMCKSSIIVHKDFNVAVV